MQESLTVCGTKMLLRFDSTLCCAAQRLQSVAYTPEGGWHAPWAIKVCLDALVQRLVGKSSMSMLQKSLLVSLYLFRVYINTRWQAMYTYGVLPCLVTVGPAW